jgi:2-polyprenyl-3-methyl-5-hydroxy-6-metoxy-1,4-benzoquinol methylase
LQEGRENANIDAGLGFIWRISVEMEKVAYEIMEDLGDTYWWYRARREIIAGVIERYVPDGGRIIDFGSGTGALTALLRDQGYQVKAADISPLALDGCRRRGLEVIDLRSQALPEQATECVILGDVLEHVKDDAALLTDIRMALAPGGCLLTTVPAYEFLWSGEDYVSQHLRRYRLPQLIAALEKSGFEVTWASYFNTLLFPAIVAALVLKRVFRPRAMYKSDLAPLSDKVNSILYRIFRAEALVLRRATFPFGASIIALATPVTCP